MYQSTSANPENELIPTIEFRYTYLQLIKSSPNCLVHLSKRDVTLVCYYYTTIYMKYYGITSHLLCTRTATRALSSHWNLVRFMCRAATRQPGKPETPLARIYNWKVCSALRTALLSACTCVLFREHHSWIVILVRTRIIPPNGGSQRIHLCICFECPHDVVVAPCFLYEDLGLCYNEIRICGIFVAVVSCVIIRLAIVCMNIPSSKAGTQKICIYTAHTSLDAIVSPRTMNNHTTITSIAITLNLYIAQIRQFIAARITRALYFFLYVCWFARLPDAFK